MNMKSLLPVWGLATMLLASSCTNEDDNSTWRSNDSVVFTSQISKEQSSRATIDNTWNENDEIGIFMKASGSELSTATAKNQKYLAATNGALTAVGEPIYFPSQGTSDFIAYYPYQANLNGTNVTVNISDQTNLSKIDLLYSNNSTNVASGSAVNLVFTHKLTQLVLNVTAGEGITGTEGLSVTLANVLTEATFDLAANKLLNDGKKSTITFNTTADGKKAQAIVIPMEEGKDRVLTFTLNGKSFAYTLPENTKFEESTKQSYNVNLSKKGDKLAVTFQPASITNWTDKPGGDINVNFDDETTPTPTPTTIFSETFETSQGNFTINTIAAPDSAFNIWTHSAQYKCMKASAYANKKAHAAEMRLESPEIDLSSAAAPKLSFEHISRFAANNSEDLQLQIKVKDGADWTTIVIPQYSSGSDWNFVSSNEIDLSTYKGKTIQLGFKYKSSATKAATWQIKNVKIVDNNNSGGSGDTPTPPAPPTPPTPEPTPTPPTTEVTTIFLEEMGTSITEVGSDKKSKKYKIAEYKDKWSITTNTYTGTNTDVRQLEADKNPHIWFPTKGGDFTIEGFNTTGYTELTLTFSIAINNATGQTNTLTLFAGETQINYPVVNTPGMNQFVEVSATLPANTTKIKFVADNATNTKGTRLDNIKLVGKK